MNYAERQEFVANILSRTKEKMMDWYRTEKTLECIVCGLRFRLEADGKCGNGSWQWAGYLRAYEDERMLFEMSTDEDHTIKVIREAAINIWKETSSIRLRQATKHLSKKMTVITDLELGREV